jgi:heavy metal sensor kinase
MIQLSFRNRIAFYYIVVTALLIAGLFFLLYIVVYNSVYGHLDSDLDAETNEVYSCIVVLDNEIVYTNPKEWQEKEHGQIEANPTFIQIIDTLGNVVKKTPNLRNSTLRFELSLKSKSYFNTVVSGAYVRQLQTAIKNPNSKTLAYLLIAIPVEESAIVLKNLGYTLIIGYPAVLLLLFLISRVIAGRFIAPLNRVIRTAEKITKENLDQRIELPPHNDEIATLTLTINSLLDRLEDVIIREKQFTADASHELRTPLSIIKGTLEVLVRKPRDTQQYVEKINYVIDEVDRMSLLIDRLLELARLESGKIKADFVEFDLVSVIQNVYERLNQSFSRKNTEFILECENECKVKADVAMTSVILENIISNSLKYSSENQTIKVELRKEKEHLICSIKDNGNGIPEEQLHRIFDRFYRVDESRNFQVSGVGLGLAIVKRLADLQHLKILVESQLNSGTTIQIIFPVI